MVEEGHGSCGHRGRKFVIGDKGDKLLKKVRKRSKFRK